MLLNVAFVLSDSANAIATFRSDTVACFYNYVTTTVFNWFDLKIFSKFHQKKTLTTQNLIPSTMCFSWAPSTNALAPSVSMPFSELCNHNRCRCPLIALNYPASNLPHKVMILTDAFVLSDSASALPPSASMSLTVFVQEQPKPLSIWLITKYSASNLHCKFMLVTDVFSLSASASALAPSVSIPLSVVHNCVTTTVVNWLTTKYPTNRKTYQLKLNVC